MAEISSFSITGLFETRDVELTLTDQALILVGPNGIGKSTVANIFYLFLSRQWVRLLEYRFSRVSLTVDDVEISARREDISGLVEFQQAFTALPSSSRYKIYFERLSQHNLLEPFFDQRQWSPAIKSTLAAAMDLPVEELSQFRRSLVRRFSTENDLFSARRLQIERQLSELIGSRLLYLPTYRRIEKDIKDIFPDFEKRIRQFEGLSGWSEMARSRSGTYYVELVSFGMEDVRRNIDIATRSLRDYSLAQYNNLSGSYLRDVIRGRADRFNKRSIDKLTDNNIVAILDRVSEDALSGADKSHLLVKIQAIQEKDKSELTSNENYLAHYFSRLVSATRDIEAREQSISSFIAVCNQYLQPGKNFVYDEISFKLSILDDQGNDIDLSMLSSGEKQIVSVFSHLYLDNNADQIMVIDEPELSLSVRWQKKFLSDIVLSERCKFVLAVTHSPFIYDNELRPYAVDLRRLTEIRGGR